MIIGVQGSYMAQPFVYNPHCGFLSLNTHPLSPPCLFEHNCSFTAQCPLCFFSSVTACLPPSPCFLSTTTYPLPLPCFFQAWLTAPTIFLWAQMLVHWSHHIFSSLTACSPLPAHHSPYHIYTSTSTCPSLLPCLFNISKPKSGCTVLYSATIWLIISGSPVQHVTFNFSHIQIFWVPGLMNIQWIHDYYPCDWSQKNLTNLSTMISALWTNSFLECHNCMLNDFCPQSEWLTACIMQVGKCMVPQLILIVGHSCQYWEFATQCRCLNSDKVPNSG